MVDNKRASDDADDAIHTLFRRALHDEPLPAAVHDRVVLQVLADVQHVYGEPPRRAPVGDTSGDNFLERLRSWLGQLRPRQALAVSGVAALAVLLIIGGISRLVPRPLAALAVVRGGEATIMRAHNNSFRAYGDGDVFKLEEGDQVITQSGTVTLTHFPKQVAVVEPGSHVELVRLDDGDGNTHVELHVSDGVVRSSIDEQLDARDEYIVTAPNLTASAHGTEFTVEAITDDEARVTTHDGEVQVEMLGQQIDVDAGEEVDAVAGKALVVERADGKSDPAPDKLLIVIDQAQVLRLYSEPHLDSQVVGELEKGRPIQIEVQHVQDGWYRVCCIQGKAGWLYVPPVATSGD
ncbi:MAG: FecR domain-containing protein [Anaerolineales bacterium]|nr:FecR domain-containing protein [Anaerolineales bacterium]